MDILYFAYGSNMSSERLAERVPGARAVGRARIADSRLRFNKPGRDGTGKANLVTQPGEWAWGVLWSLAEPELARLDRYELGYQRVPLPVDPGGGDVRTAQVYLWRRSTPEIRPTSWYVAHLIAGAIEHGLPETWIARLREIHRRVGEAER